MEGVKEMPDKHIENIMQADVFRERLAMHAIVFSSQADSVGNRCLYITGTITQFARRK
jgi:hypothetical protein